ncbi:p-hydroxyphenylacetate 3-hydroxylase, reductase component [Paraburkholderia domus]|uniref:flavin reductase n=1 Tax=Paraburkholderia domus TaxID=2793075 RepID=UPI00191177D3|nr:flavin reductase [Paraburkholderia domus]MBK5050456.1 flavin reductase [Burkholderia sp. R-70006]CAE6754666.1 p-hydroxyphenylacetate 3-hydroxylase, reductase component [Paraburkholderia domus]
MTTLSSIDGKEFRKALGAFATGVTVVTCKGSDGGDVGLTANSFNSVSLNPPMVLWSLGKNSSNLNAFMHSDHFAVHILSVDQENISNQFAKSAIDRFAGVEMERGVADVPLLGGCSARFECRTTYRYEGGDHVIFVGEVVSFQSFGHAPLVFHSGKYGLLLKRFDEASSDPHSNFGDDFLGFLLRRAYFQLMTPLRADVQRRGLNEIHRSILSILSMGDGRNMTEVGRLLELTGHQAGEEHFRDLAMQGLIELRDGEENVHAHFTAAGRNSAIEHMAVGKAAEEDAMQDLDPQEARLLKVLLNRVIRNTRVNLPHALGKEKFWRENNIWGARGSAQS